jgi:hypothetical protein
LERRAGAIEWAIERDVKWGGYWNTSMPFLWAAISGCRERGKLDTPLVIVAERKDVPPIQLPFLFLFLSFFSFLSSLYIHCHSRSKVEATAAG